MKAVCFVALKVVHPVQQDKEMQRVLTFRKFIFVNNNYFFNISFRLQFFFKEKKNHMGVFLTITNLISSFTFQILY